MGKLFGTDGIRGKFGEYPMTVDMAEQIGRATAKFFEAQRKTKILIGKDTRVSSDPLEKALTRGLQAAGANVVLVGHVPTPAVAYLTRELECDAGIMISASHNPSHDNGIKFFDKEGFKLKDREESKFEKLILDKKTATLKSRRQTAVTRMRSAVKKYAEKVKDTLDHPLEGMRIVLDCANGAASSVAPEVLQSLGAEVIVLNNQPNGTNINLNCGSVYPHVVAEHVRLYGSDVGISLDGDADRVILVDEEGAEICGDTLLAICATNMLQKQELNKNSLVVTNYSNRALRVLMERSDCKVIETKNGDKYVAHEMRKKGANLGGEQSGHIIFMDHNTTGDGLLSACQVLNIMKEKKKSLSDLSVVLRKYPQKTVSVEVDKKTPFEKSAEVMTAVEEAQDAMGQTSRVMLRYSGTEPQARIMVEGIDAEEVEYYAHKIAEEVRKFAGPVTE